MSENQDEDGNGLPTGSQSNHIRSASSWDGRQQQQQENQQASGEDTASDSRGSHHKVQSWSGTFVGLAQGVFGGSSSSPSSNISRPPLPPPPPSPLTTEATIVTGAATAAAATQQRIQRRPSTEEQNYRRQNQQFLQQQQQQQHIVVPLKTARSTKGPTNYGATPSPNTQFRKRLHLRAIEEDDGASFVVVEGSNRSRNNTAVSSQQQHQPDAPDVLLSSAPLDQQQQQHDWTTSSIRFQQDDTDDMSMMSSLAGSLVGGSFNNNNNNNINSNSYRMMMAMMNGKEQSSSSSAVTTEAELAKFEQAQEEQFQQKKQDMERKLSDALQRNGATKEENNTNEFVQSYLEELEKERTVMLAQWKSEMRMEQERMRQDGSRQRLSRDCYDALIKPWVDPIISVLSNAEVVLSNMPVTIGALGLSWVTMGVVWFKFTEEMLDSCQHVHYFSSRCKFREFPGCFECDETNQYYKIALHFHWLCSTVSAIACGLFVLKIILAPQTVLHMLQNPTTSTPVGVWCIAMVCTFAGQHGALGEAIVLVTSCLHVVLAFWFLHMAVFKFRLWADPGWFPCVVGISYAAIKTWIYFPDVGLFLVALCTIFFLGTFFFSVVRVALNHKIAAPVCWIQLSAPSITLYALTLISQPTRNEELEFATSNEAKQQYEHFVNTWYMPTQHVFMALTMVGLVSAVHSLWVRWPTFKHKPFSPAHVAFCFPTLSHTNCIQAYRASLLGYSSIPEGHFFRKALFGYWCFFLVVGTILNIVFTVKYVLRIPEWTRPDLTGEEEPPAHSQTIVDEIMDGTGAHETMLQPFVSPAVLEANETGVLIRVRRGTEEYRRYGPYVRTRNVSSLGFDPILSQLELREERARLLDWVARNAPRKRNRTMSVPGVSHFRRDDGNGVYGTFSGTDLSQAETLVQGHARSKTSIGTSRV